MGNVKDIRKPKGVEVNLGGHVMRLKFDLNAFALLEEHYGDIEKAMGSLEKGSVKALRAILWAGLVHEHLDKDGEPTLTQREVGSMIEIQDLPMLSDLLGEALGQAFPEEKEGAGPVPLPRKGKKK